MPARKKSRPKAEPTREVMPVYTISVAARLCEMPTYTIRWLESHELVRPARTEGNQRLFSDEDIQLLHEIAELLEEGVNLAGVRAVFRLKHRLEHSEDEEGLI